MGKIQIISTTSAIENWKVEKYLGIVTDQIVLGANLFHDVFSSFRDVFGGSSKSYQKDLSKMENIVLDNLKRKASKLGANIILGLRLDFDEVSGGGKSMFMLSASGTAVSAIPPNNNPIVEEEEIITYQKLSYEIERERILNDINKVDFKINSIKQIQTLNEYNVIDVKNSVNYLNNNPTPSEEIYELMVDYFKSVPINDIDEYLKSEHFVIISNDTFSTLYKILDAINWYSFNVFKSLLVSNNPISHQRALFLFRLVKLSYSKEDISRMEEIYNLIGLTFSKYPILKKVKGIIGKETESWECINCGTTNNKENSECKKFECQANIYGIPNNKINPEIVKDSLKIKINKLKQLFNVT
jgi:uncharacterized protein YbjQ (UPF0145 family)